MQITVAIVSNFEKKGHLPLPAYPHTVRGETLGFSISNFSAMEEIMPIFMDPETEFLASKQETGNEWELFKENVRPLKRGRNVKLLNDSLKSHADIQIRNSLIDNRRY